MRVFITGASGWIGSAVIPELIDAGHQVTGLARSDASAAPLTAAGAEVLRGTIDDLDTLRAAAAITRSRGSCGSSPCERAPGPAPVRSSRTG